MLHDDRGSVAVELAFGAPILLGIIVLLLLLRYLVGLVLTLVAGAVAWRIGELGEIPSHRPAEVRQETGPA